MRTAQPGYLVLFTLVAACAGRETGDASATAVTRDSSGVTIVEHSAAAVEAVPMMVPAEAVLSIGGPEADEEHDATFFSRGWLFDDGLVVHPQSDAPLLPVRSGG